MTGTASAVLIRWNNGHVYVGGGGSEMYVNMSGVATKKQALAYGATILAGQGGTLSTRAVQGPAYWSPDGDAHYPPAVLSDYEGRRVVGFTASMSGDQTMVTPVLNDPIADARDALKRRIERASTDTVSLWGSPRREPRNQGGGEASSPDTFSVSGPLNALFEPVADDEEDPRESPWWRPKVSFWGAWVSATLKKPGATASHVQFLRAVEKGSTVNVEVVSDCYIAGGKRRGISRIAPAEGVIAAGEASFMRVVAYGAGASDLTVQVHGSTI